MKRFISLLVSSFALLIAFSCGKKGPLQPPLVRTPQKVEELAVFQRGGKVILDWTNPGTYLDGNPLPGISEVEVWVLEVEALSGAEMPDISLSDFEKKSRREAVIRSEQFPDFRKKDEKTRFEFRYIYTIPSGKRDIIGIVFSLRIKDNRGRKSALSDLRRVEPQVLPLPPGNLRTILSEDRIEVLWEAPEANTNGTSPPRVVGYNVFRSEGEEPAVLLNVSLISGKKYEDRGFQFGQKYRYFVRASASETSPFQESENSDTADLHAEDMFPPSPPSGLVAISGEGYVTLSWEANREEDLAGYRVWRREEGRDDHVLLTQEPIVELSSTDSTVEKNKRYYYAITAVDLAGNESRKSQEATEIAKEGFR